MRIAINGFGRIGRSIARLVASAEDVELLLINDLAPAETCAHLFEYDSVFGPWSGTVRTAGDRLVVNDRPIAFRSERDIGALDLVGVDVLLECTGQPHIAHSARSALAAGAQRVLISGPAADADGTFVLGGNDGLYSGQRIVSNGSCTTNALAPILRILDSFYGVRGGHMTTVHCYTGSQPTVDQHRGELSRSRAAALSMIPTATSAQQILGQILPHLAGKIQCRALRVPTPSVSAIDLTVALSRPPHASQMEKAIKMACLESPILGWTERPLVSVDLRGRSESLIISGPELSMASGGLLRLFGWYDNEWGFASRMLDMARIISASRFTESRHD